LKSAIRKGLSFGITSAVITTLGIIVGVHSGTDLQHAIIAAILIIAFADSLADSCGILFSEQAREDCSTKDSLISAVTAFLGKVFFALTFIVPLVLLPLHAGIIVCIVYGLTLLVIYSAVTAKTRQESALKAITQYVLLAVIVIVLSHIIGLWVNRLFS
jgi:vacuolar iron transporter family protein